MSRKTAVCLLFVFLLGLVGTALPAQPVQQCATQFQIGGSTTLVSISSGDGQDGDPDGLHAFAPNGTFLQFIRIFVSPFIL